MPRSAIMMNSGTQCLRGVDSAFRLLGHATADDCHLFTISVVCWHLLVSKGFAVFERLDHHTVPLDDGWPGQLPTRNSGKCEHLVMRFRTDTRPVCEHSALRSETGTRLICGDTEMQAQYSARQCAEIAGSELGLSQCRTCLLAARPN